MWIPVKVQGDFKNARHLILQNVTALKLRRFQTITSEDNLNLLSQRRRELNAKSLMSEIKSVRRHELLLLLGAWRTACYWLYWPFKGYKGLRSVKYEPCE